MKINKNNPEHISNFLGELIGTLILVFFGCGSIAVSILFSSHSGLFQIAAIWGISVALAIYATRHISCAHLNPAVSIAMVVAGRIKSGKRLLPQSVCIFSGLEGSCFSGCPLGVFHGLYPWSSRRWNISCFTI